MAKLAPHRIPDASKCQSSIPSLVRCRAPELRLSAEMVIGKLLPSVRARDLSRGEGGDQIGKHTATEGGQMSRRTKRMRKRTKQRQATHARRLKKR